VSTGLGGLPPPPRVGQLHRSVITTPVRLRAPLLVPNAVGPVPARFRHPTHVRRPIQPCEGDRGKHDAYLSHTCIHPNARTNVRSQPRRHDRLDESIAWASTRRKGIPLSTVEVTLPQATEGSVKRRVVGPNHTGSAGCASTDRGCHGRSGIEPCQGASGHQAEMPDTPCLRFTAGPRRRALWWVQTPRVRWRVPRAVDPSAAHKLRELVKVFSLSS